MKKIYNKQKIKKALEIDIYPRGGGKIDLRTLADTADHVVVNDDAGDGGSSGGDNEFNAKFIVIPDDAEPSPSVVMNEWTDDSVGFERSNCEYCLAIEPYNTKNYNFLFKKEEGLKFVSNEDELNDVYLSSSFMYGQTTPAFAPEFVEYMMDSALKPMGPGDSLEQGEVALIKQIDGSNLAEIIATYRVYKVNTQGAILAVTDSEGSRAYIVSLKFDREVTWVKDNIK